MMTIQHQLKPEPNAIIRMIFSEDVSSNRTASLKPGYNLETIETHTVANKIIIL